MRETIPAASVAVTTRSNSCFLRSCAVYVQSFWRASSANRFNSGSPVTLSRGSSSTRSKMFVTAPQRLPNIRVDLAGDARLLLGRHLHAEVIPRWNGQNFELDAELA